MAKQDGSQNDPLLKVHIDRNVPEPAYLQIAASIKALLQSGKLPANTAMPPEAVLAQRFGVSRMTMRQANDLLEREGLIDRQRGRGTFSASSRILKEAQETRSFSEEIRRRGGVPSSRMVSFRTIAAAAVAASEYFGVALGEPLYEIQRVRLADGVPIAFESTNILSRLCPNLERFNLADYSLYQILEENYGIHLAKTEEEISAIQPTSLHRKMLNVPRNVSILLIKRKTYTTDGKPLELGATAYRGDLYSAIIYSSRSRKQQPTARFPASS